jgi:hypothetical protein
MDQGQQLATERQSVFVSHPFAQVLADRVAQEALGQRGQTFFHLLAQILTYLSAKPKSADFWPVRSAQAEASSKSGPKSPPSVRTQWKTQVNLAISLLKAWGSNPPLKDLRLSDAQMLIAMNKDGLSLGGCGGNERVNQRETARWRCVPRTAAERRLPVGQIAQPARGDVRSQHGSHPGWTVVEETKA